MDRGWYLDAIEREGAMLVAACAAAPGAQVPACPEWNTEALVDHIARVHDFWSHCVATPLRTIDEVIAFDESRGAIPDATTARAALLDALNAASDDQQCWTWAPEQQVGFVTRFQATEVLLHRVDAQQAAKLPVEIDPVAASESIDVFLSYCCAAPATASAEVGGSVHIHCTDIAGEWTVGADGALSRGHSKGDVALRGRAHDLLLALWHRGPLAGCEVLGDASVAQRFVARSSVE